MEQYFVLDGVLKRVVSNAQGKEMILRFAAESDIDTSYAAWKLKTPMPYSIRAVTKVRAAKLSMLQCSCEDGKIKDILRPNRWKDVAFPIQIEDIIQYRRCNRHR